MKEVNIDIVRDIKDIESAYKLLPCYDGIIDGEPSWYGGLIKAAASDGVITFSHDMPNREWDSWLENAVRIFGARE